MESNRTKARKKHVSLGSVQDKDKFQAPRTITSIFHPMTNTNSSAKGVLKEKSDKILVVRQGPINDNLALRDRSGNLEMNKNNKKTVVGDIVSGLKPYSGGLDFELAFFRMVHITFPKMDMIGCLYHFKKTEERKPATKRGVYDLITVLPKDEPKERSLLFVQKKRWT